jgi:hypothetical protein
VTRQLFSFVSVVVALIYIYAHSDGSIDATSVRSTSIAFPEELGRSALQNEEKEEEGAVDFQNANHSPDDNLMDS